MQPQPSPVLHSSVPFAGSSKVSGPWTSSACSLVLFPRSPGVWPQSIKPGTQTPRIEEHRCSVTRVCTSHWGSTPQQALCPFHPSHPLHPLLMLIGAHLSCSCIPAQGKWKHVHTQTGTRIFTASGPTNAPGWRQSMCPRPDAWTGTTRPIRTTDRVQE